MSNFPQSYKVVWHKKHCQIFLDYIWFIISLLHILYWTPQLSCYHCPSVLSVSDNLSDQELLVVETCILLTMQLDPYFWQWLKLLVSFLSFLIFPLHYKHSFLSFQSFLFVFSFLSLFGFLESKLYISNQIDFKIKKNSSRGGNYFIMMIFHTKILDTYQHSLILTALMKIYGADELTVAWFRSFLCGRTQRVRIGGYNSVVVDNVHCLRPKQNRVFNDNCRLQKLKMTQ